MAVDITKDAHTALSFSRRFGASGQAASACLGRRSWKHGIALSVRRRQVPCLNGAGACGGIYAVHDPGEGVGGRRPRFPRNEATLKPRQT